MRVKEIVKVTGGSLISGDPEAEILPSRISTDSRTIKKGDLFIALKGPNFDGAGFVPEVFAKGAVGALLACGGAGDMVKRKIIINVKDTTEALREIARSHRVKFKIPVIAVTGSNGKTTAKDMIWGVLSVRYDTLKNDGTKNNHIGVPQTLLGLDDRHRACVLELGANHKGEIRMLGDIARPTICVITNIGPSHLEFLGSTRGVYREKIEALRSLGRRGMAVLNGDDRLLSMIRDKALKIVRFGFKASNDFRGKLLSAEPGKMRFMLNGAEEFELRLLGVHNIYNALAAIAVGRHFDISYGVIREALFNYRPADMRLDLKKINGLDIINDAYNSNPMSMKRALEVIQYYPARARWVVSGDMLELGRYSVRFHKMVGEMAARSGIEGLLTFGELSKHTLARAGESGMNKDKLWHCSSCDEIAAILKKVAERGDVILLKGSRAMRMEEVLEKL